MGRRYAWACSENWRALSDLTRWLAGTKISFLLRLQSQQCVLEVFECFHCYRLCGHLTLNLLLLDALIQVDFCAALQIQMLSSVSLGLCLSPTEYYIPKNLIRIGLFSFFSECTFFEAQGLWIYKPHPTDYVEYFFLSHRQGLLNSSSHKCPTTREKLGLLEGTTFPGMVILVILSCGQWFF